MNSSKSEHFQIIRVALTVIFGLSITVIIIFLNSCHSNRKIIGAYQTSVFDSKAAVYPYYNSESMMSAMVSNNDSNLYIALKFYKQEIQFQMVTSGMTLTIDTAGKKDGGYSVIYPLGRKSRMEVGDPNQKPSGAMMRGNIGNDRRDHILMAMGPSMLLSGFDGLEKREYQLHNCGSIAIKTVLDSNNFLFYQLQIPFAQMQTLRNTYRNLDTNRVFHLNINIKAVSISRPPNHPNGGGMQHPPGQGGGMRPSGGPPPGGGQGGPHPDISQVSNDIRLRIPFVLKLNDL